MALDVPLCKIGTREFIVAHLAEPSCATFDLRPAVRRGPSSPGHVLLGVAGNNRWRPLAGTSALAAEGQHVRVTVVDGPDHAMLLAGLHAGMLQQPREADPELAAAVMVEILNAEVKLFREFDISHTTISDRLKDLLTLGPAWVRSANSVGRSQPTLSRRARDAMARYGGDGMIDVAQAITAGRAPKAVASLQERALQRILAQNDTNSLTKSNLKDLFPKYYKVERDAGPARVGWYCASHGGLQAPYPPHMSALFRTATRPKALRGSVVS